MTWLRFVLNFALSAGGVLVPNGAVTPWREAAVVLSLIVRKDGIATLTSGFTVCTCVSTEIVRFFIRTFHVHNFFTAERLIFIFLNIFTGAMIARSVTMF